MAGHKSGGREKEIDVPTLSVCHVSIRHSNKTSRVVVVKVPNYCRVISFETLHVCRMLVSKIPILTIEDEQ